jgi:hypothetical protein
VRAEEGIPGPERPDTEISKIAPDFNPPEATLRDAVLDGIDFDSLGIAVLPGTHQLYVTWGARGRKLDCDRFSEFDDSGYESCLDDRKRRKDCSCWDYVEIEERCTYEVVELECQKSITTAAGRSYAIVPGGTFLSPKLELRDTANQGSSSALRCDRGRVSEEPFVSDLGSGRYSAERYGVRTACD